MPTLFSIYNFTFIIFLHLWVNFVKQVIKTKKPLSKSRFKIQIWLKELYSNTRFIIKINNILGYDYLLFYYEIIIEAVF